MTKITLNKSIKMQVNGIHCNGCASKIQKGVESLGIDQETQVDVATGVVRVKYNSEQANAIEIKNKIEEAGYTVESLSLE
jgi:copper chaperone